MQTQSKYFAGQACILSGSPTDLTAHMNSFDPPKNKFRAESVILSKNPQSHPGREVAGSPVQTM